MKAHTDIRSELVAAVSVGEILELCKERPVVEDKEVPGGWVTYAPGGCATYTIKVVVGDQELRDELQRLEQPSSPTLEEVCERMVAALRLAGVNP